MSGQGAVWAAAAGIATLAVLAVMTGCRGAVETTAATPLPTVAPAATPVPATPEQAQQTKEETMYIQIGDVTLEATPAQNEAGDALLRLLEEGPLTIRVENFGGFEKVGSLPQSLPQQDTRITTQPGDIMLYQGNSIVFFYGSNTWAYTRLGTIRNATQEELEKAFGGSETTIQLTK